MNYNEIVKQSISKSDFAKHLGFKYHNGRVAGIINGIIRDYKLDISHFKSNGGGWNKKYPFVEKKCPVCGNIFMSQVGRGKRDKITCSYKCCNTFFKHVKKKVKSYNAICFRHHKKECIICKENRIVAVHHFDENRKNNSPENLIPMCPTHHQYYHSRYKHLVLEDIKKYRDNFVKSECRGVNGSPPRLERGVLSDLAGSSPVIPTNGSQA